MSKNFHESFSEAPVALPSERSTGLVFTAVVLIVAYFWRSNVAFAAMLLALAAALAATSLVAPALLRPLNIAWFKFGLLLNKIVSPVVMMAMFLIAIVPFGLVMQMRADPLRKRRRADAKSYWIERGAAQSTMRNQF